MSRLILFWMLFQLKEIIIYLLTYLNSISIKKNYLFYKKGTRFPIIHEIPCPMNKVTKYTTHLYIYKALDIKREKVKKMLQYKISEICR